MTFRAIALTYAVGLALAVGAFATTAHVTPAHVTTDADPAQDAATRTAAPPVSLSWAPDWLMTPLSRAIADAADPRDRSSR